MNWEKKGLIFIPDKDINWMVAYAALPVAYHLDGDIYRIYFAGRNDRDQSSIGYFEMDITNPTEVINVSKEPVLSYGDTGYFDSDGVYPSSILRMGDKLYMYYIGWVKGVPEPLFRSSIGLAISKDNGVTFEKYSKAPILDRSEVDPLLLTSPTVIKLDDILIMYYVSGVKWIYLDGELHSNYLLKQAYSKDGIVWERKNDIAVPFEHVNEEHIARMSVIRTDNEYEGWYSYECGDGYRIGMAKSKNGKKWSRHDEDAGMRLSLIGWDSEAQAYPYVFMHRGRRYMLYNGNRNGYDGIGLAIEV